MLYDNYVVGRFRYFSCHVSFVQQVQLSTLEPLQLVEYSRNGGQPCVCSRVQYAVECQPFISALTIHYSWLLDDKTLSKPQAECVHWPHHNVHAVADAEVSWSASEASKAELCICVNVFVLASYEEQ